MSEIYGNITDVSGIQVGHEENREEITGCTAILVEGGAVCGVDVRGSAPGTVNTDMLNPLNSVEEVHGICLSGGSAYGLESAFGMMEYLEKKGVGLAFAGRTIPMVPGAIIFDLTLGSGKVRPDKAMGYQAAQNAKSGVLEEGNVGAGLGASVGKLAGMERAMKGGLGSASLRLDNGLTIGALVVVNAVGEVRDMHTGEIIAGVRDEEDRLIPSIELLKKYPLMGGAEPGMNTTIGLVASNAILSKAEAAKVAGMAHNGLARTIYPIHTSMDGDTIFSLATGEMKSSVDLVGELSAIVLAEAVTRAVQAAKSLPGLPAARDM